MSLRKGKQFVKEVEEVHEEIEDIDRVRHLLNMQLFYHAGKQLPEMNQHLPPSNGELIGKIMGQLIGRKDKYEIVEQLKQRIKIMTEDGDDQLTQLKAKWKEEESKIRRSNAKVKDFQHIYEEQIKKEVIFTPLLKKTAFYFESSKDITLEEMLKDLLHTLSPEQEEEEDQAEEDIQVELEDDVRNQCDLLLEQFKLVGSAFDFQE